MYLLRYPLFFVARSDEGFTIFGLGIFDLFDFVTAKIMLTLGGLCISIFTGWYLDKKIVWSEITNDGSLKVPVYKLIIFILRYIAPIAISLILSMSWDLSNYNVERLFFYLLNRTTRHYRPCRSCYRVYTIPALLQAFSGPEKTDPTEQAKSEKEYNEFISSIKEAKQDKKYPVYRGRYSSPAYPKKEIRPAAFDPNTADSATFLSLGLPTWMAGNILRYRRKQGRFRRPEDFGKYTG